MWMTIFMIAMAIAVICVAVNQIIMNFAVKGLRRQWKDAEKKLTGLEERGRSHLSIATDSINMADVMRLPMMEKAFILAALDVLRGVEQQGGENMLKEIQELNARVDELERRIQDHLSIEEMYGGAEKARRLAQQVIDLFSNEEGGEG